MTSRTIKIVSWNVNGIRAVLKKDFAKSIEKINPDILCIQETKAHPDQVDELMHDYEHHFWNSAEKKGYSGTAVFSKIKPVSVVYGDGPMNDTEGRIITVEYDTFYLVNVYTPNSKRALERLNGRCEWDTKFLQYLKGLEKKKPVVLCGDLNVAHTEIDLANPKSNYNKNAGFTQKEIDGFENYLSHGFIDTFRHFYPNKEDQYTWWTYMFKSRERNVGWRIDYFLISKSLKSDLTEAFILPEVLGSDHCPVGITLNM